MRRYGPRRVDVHRDGPLRSDSPAITTGLAYDTLTVHLGADVGLSLDWTPGYTIQLTSANTTDGGD
jgi:hypothetical protein